jgi:phosphoserine phosphatase
VDGAWVRHRAAEAGGLADEVREIAERARRASDAQWESTAATAFRRCLDAEVRRLLAVAAAVDDGAAALRLHAAALEAISPLPVIGAVVQRVLP